MRLYDAILMNAAICILADERTLYLPCLCFQGKTFTFQPVLNPRHCGLNQPTQHNWKWISDCYSYGTNVTITITPLVKGKLHSSLYVTSRAEARFTTVRISWKIPFHYCLKRMFKDGMHTAENSNNIYIKNRLYETHTSRASIFEHTQPTRFLH